MKDGRHEHSLGNRFGLHHHKKTFGIAVFALIFAVVAYSSAQSIDLNSKVNKSGDNITGNIDMGNMNITTVHDLNFTGDLTGTNHVNKIMLKGGVFGSTIAAGVNYSYLALNLYHDGTNWNLINASDTGTLFIFGSAQNAGSNTFVVYQTQTPGALDFVALFGSNYPQRMSIGSYTAAAALDINGGDQQVRIGSMTGTANDFVCVNATGYLFRSSTAC